MSRSFAQMWGDGIEPAFQKQIQKYIDELALDGELDNTSYVPPTTPGNWQLTGRALGKTVYSDSRGGMWTATSSPWARPKPCKRALKYRPPTSSRIWPMCNGVDPQAARSIQQNTQPPRPTPLGAPASSGQQWTMYTGINVMGTRPSSPSPGDTYFDVTSGEMRTWTGTHWAQLSSGITANRDGFADPGLTVRNLAQAQQPKPWWKRGWKK